MSAEYGVYIGQNCELVIIKKYTVIFLFYRDALYTFLTQTTDQKCIHVVRTKLDGQQATFEYLLKQQGGMNYVKGNGHDYPMIQFNEKQIVEIQPVKNGIKCHFPSVEYITTEAALHESITPSSIQPLGIPANPDTIETCLNTWHLGLHEITEYQGGKKYFKGIILNTPKHMYIYEVSCNGSIYVRAARYACFKKGIVFHQNYRQHILNDGKATASVIAPKNNTFAALPLTCDEGLFQPNTCILNNFAFYWPMIDYEPYHIRLSGCDGAIYHWRPKTQVH